MIKISHSISDGVGFMCFLNDITDNPKLEGYPNMMLSISTIQRVFLTLAAPIYSQIETFKMLLRPDDKSCFKLDENKKKYTALKSSHFLPDISLE